MRKVELEQSTKDYLDEWRKNRPKEEEPSNGEVRRSHCKMCYAPQEQVYKGPLHGWKAVAGQEHLPINCINYLRDTLDTVRTELLYIKQLLKEELERASE